MRRRSFGKRRRRLRNSQAAAGNMNSGLILDLLRAKHADDLFVEECKDGGSWTRQHRRLDVWVMKRTWTPPTTIGYEIKVSRSDWMGDQKFTAYMELAHYFYVVAPKGIVKEEELPDSCGLMEVAGTGKGLRTIRKAARREIEWPGKLMAYILMSRTRITNTFNSAGERLSRAQELAKLIKDYGQTDPKLLGERVAQIVGVYRGDLENRLECQSKRIEQAERIEVAARRLGINLFTYSPDAEIQRRIFGAAKVAIDELETIERQVRAARVHIEAEQIIPAVQ